MLPKGFLVCATLIACCTVALAQPGPGAGRRRMAKEPACRQMLEETTESDARFDEQVKRMNATQGPERIDAIVAALNELAARHRTMRERMASMPCAAGCPGGPGCPMMGQ
jgi:hypothetical protein